MRERPVATEKIAVLSAILRRGGSAVEGNGLRVMRERIEGLGGTLEHHREAGTRIVVTLPRRQAGPGTATVPADGRAPGLVPLPETGS